MLKKGVDPNELTEDEFNMFFIGVYNSVNGKLTPNPNYKGQDNK